MERNVLALPSFGGANEESERLDLVEEDRGSFPGAVADAALLLSSTLESGDSTRYRGLKCKSMS